MAVRKPLVINSAGFLAELPATDTIDISGGGSNRVIYTATYSASNTFTLAAIPTKIYEVRVYNSTNPMLNPVAAYTWTAGTNSVTITDTLASGDTLYFDVELNPVSNTTVFSRSVNSISTTQTAGSAALTDYVYLCTGTMTLTLPTAVGNTNRYTVKRVGSGTITVATTSSQTIDGSTTAALTVQYQTLEFISDNANWNII